MDWGWFDLEPKMRLLGRLALEFPQWDKLPPQFTLANITTVA